MDESTVRIYIGKIPPELVINEDGLFPPARVAEIRSCMAEKKRKEKYCAWKILQYALKDAFALDMTKMRVEKLPNGKWIANECCFSLSHAGDLVVVALSKTDVGVDVEKDTDKILKLNDKFLTDREKTEFLSLKAEEKKPFLWQKWTQKESIFKAYKKGGFLPRETDTHEYNALTETRELLGEKYYLSVAGENVENAIWFFVDEYLGV